MFVDYVETDNNMPSIRSDGGAPMRTDLSPETTRFEKVHAGLATLGTRQGVELRNALRFSPRDEGIVIQRLLELQSAGATR
jgi:hypothetical protein